MLDHILKARSSPQGTTIGGIRAYELTCEVAFLGRRRRVYSRLVALSGARPGDQVLDVGVAQDLTWPDGSFDVVTCTLAVHHIPGTARASAFSEMYRVTRPGGRLLVADFRPSRWHPGPHGMRHSDPTLLGGLAESAGFRVEATGDLPQLRYVRAMHPESGHDASAVP